MTVLFKRSSPALFLVFLCFSGCDGSSTSSGYGKTVTYTISQTSGPSCPGATVSEGNRGSTWRWSECTWYCASYKGKKKYVSLTFRKTRYNGYVWELQDVYTSDC